MIMSATNSTLLRSRDHVNFMIGSRENASFLYFARFKHCFRRKTSEILVAYAVCASAGYMAGDVYSRGGQSGPGGPTTPSGGPPNMSSSGGNSKPGSDYGSYGGYGSYPSATDASGYGVPQRSYGSDAGSQVGGYSSQPPNAGAKHFNDFKEWPSS